LGRSGLSRPVPDRTRRPVQAGPSNRIPYGAADIPNLGAVRSRPSRPIAAPLECCAELLGVDLATVMWAAEQVEPYLRADGTPVWSLMQLVLQPQSA